MTEPDEDVCPITNTKHKPDWKTVTEEWDGDTLYIDVSCKDCGRSGCVGTSESLCDDISW